MKLFHSEPEQDDVEQEHIVEEHIEFLEHEIDALRHRVSQRRMLLNNAGKTLQEFQDSIYAMLIEENAPKKSSSKEEHAESDASEAEEDDELFNLLSGDEEEA